MVEEVTTLHIIQEKVDSQVILEHVVHVQDEGILGLEEDVLLSPCINDLSFFDENILIYPFHSIFLAIMDVHDQEYLAKTAFVDDLFDLEVFELYDSLYHRLSCLLD